MPTFARLGSYRMRVCAFFSVVTLKAPVFAASFGADVHGISLSRSDEDDLEWVRSERPAAAAKLTEGDALLRPNASPADLENAVTLLRDAAREAAPSALAARRLCEALTALGRHAEAVSACDAAMSRGGKVPDMRAAVGALMSGSDAPTVSEAGRALHLARRAVEILPNEAFGHAAQCEIAEKLGDTEMLTNCATALSRIAPHSSDALRARRALQRARPGAILTGVWIGLAASLAITVLHAARRALLRARTPHKTAGVVLSALLFAVAGSSHAEEAAARLEQRRVVAGHLSQYPIDEADPESSVPSPEQRDRDPLEYGYFLMDLGDAAEKASLRGDHVRAARFYRAIVRAVPDAAVGYRKACEELEAASEWLNAKSFCAAALTQRDAMLADYSHYARVVFGAGTELEPQDIRNLDAVVRHLETEKTSQTVAWDIECNLGVRLGDARRLQDCTTRWAATDPKDSKVIFYRWVLALHQGNYRAATGLVDEARAASVEPATVLHMQQATYRAMPVWRRGFRDWRFGAGIAALLVAALTVVVLRSRREPTPAPPPAQ